jgi:outer membrane protein, multidrug efflux system
VIQTVLQDVRYAYYRAAGTKELLEEMELLLRRARSAYEQSKKVSYQKLRPMVETMTYQRELLDNIRILWGLIRTLATAKTELATLMNVRPGSSFEVLPPGEQAIPAMSPDMASLEEMAMQFRPELREEDYKARISALEVRKTIIGMLPGLNLSLGYNYDSNDLLYKKNWWSAGAEISMNLLSLISGPARYRAAKTRQEVDSVRRQAVGMAVMAQVHIAYQRYALATEEFEITDELTGVDEALTTQMTAEQAAGRVTELALIQTATDAMVSRVRSQLAYAELQNAAGTMYTSLGIDLMPETVESQDVKTLAEALKTSWEEWQTRVSQ